ncbi:Nuclear protein 96 [Drechmeria coniospora]|uniref:Nuclear protein 96 n=1 Tax=Drechmeria coniospora TaxID=98403 RepID=A0A151GDH8_DRECN|nr:Nuclear protein 96 [Drechmeria coniospora]KYK55162.1 Nuclear protein 96 [Drechmeria coniospora]
MSFGSGGFGGFGSNNNQPSGGFGGFGANSNTANTTTSAFGATNTGGFGQGANAGGFGQAANTGGTMFGAAANTAAGGFGGKPAFGAANTTGGLFGSPVSNNNAGTSAFGGFGGTANTSSPFGAGTAAANTTGGGLFGGNNANKTGFGTTATAGTSLFGGGNTNTTGGFGTGGFGAANNPGLGGGVGDPPGTNTTPFQAFTEKEPTSNQTNSYQNVLFQDPYKKWSSDELRLTDYVQGRRHGNASGAGAFGVGSNFGGGFGASNQSTTTGFGAATTTNTTGGLFGTGNTANTTAFGQTGTGGFGAANTQANAAGGLFGASKPSGGLFGTSATQQTGGGLFGGNAAAGGFGAATNTTGAFGAAANTNTGGGLFGASNQANKPQGSGFSFGNTAAANTNATAFGNTGAGFGAANTNTAGGGLFGNTNNTLATGGGLFGNAQQQQAQQQNTGGAFGAGFGAQNQTQQTGGLFGGNQQKPATGGLFGASTTTTGGGLFGTANNQQQNATGFGANTAAAGGGLFGAAKPNTGGGLFGNTNTAQTATAGGGGLFGSLGASNQTQQATGSSLFGAANSTQQKPGGLFGSTNQVAGSGLFGGQNNQTQGSSLFGGTNQQQVQNPGLGGSLLGTSQQGSNAPQGLTANLNDVSAYGSPSLFAGIGGNEVTNPGPLATSVIGNSKPRRSSILPMYKLAPAAASRFGTPQKRGFGFSYGAYGTPGASPASSISSTPGGLGRSLLGSSASGSLSKSMSTNNLRRSFNTEDSILAPGAFSTNSSSRWFGSIGSKKLVINREIRSDLFSTPQKEKNASDGGPSTRKLTKRVSFDTSNVDGEESAPVRGALPAPPEDSPSSHVEDEGATRQGRLSIGTNGSKTPEMEQVKGNELAIVHEEDNSSTPEPPKATGFDNVPGDYWMKPSKEELLGMNRMQRQRIDSFTVGRDHVGSITFKVPVDISNIEVEEICGSIVQLEPRSATVYPVQAKKPPVGKGLNVPARISLEQSWPRGGRDKRVTSDPKRFNKHVERLKRIPDTTFETYDKGTGVWTFSVEHFTTYGLDDSDDESDSELPPPAPDAGLAAPPPRFMPLDVSADTPIDDDTFDFREHKSVPGAFDEHQEIYGEEAGKQSFLGVSSADSAPNNVTLSLDEYDDEMDDGYDMSEDEDMTRSSIGRHHAAEQDDTSSESELEAKRGTPGGILRARMRAVKDSAGPMQLEVADGDDWMEMLRKTASPVKRDRQLLRELNESPSKLMDQLATFDDAEYDGRKSSAWAKSMLKNDRAGGMAASTRLVMDKGRGFATSIDLMNSLFEKPKPSRRLQPTATSGKGFPQWPYERQDKTLTVEEAERAFHDGSRPTWGPDETLVVTRSLDLDQAGMPLRDRSGILTFQQSGIQTETQDIRLARFSTESSKKFLRSQDRVTEIELVDSVPMAVLRAASLQDVFHHQDMNDPANVHEKRVWELASILFDAGREDELGRKARLSQFWTELVESASSTNIGLAGTSEEKAVACLAGHRITEACKHLLDGKNFRLGTLVPLIGTSDAAKEEMKEQLKAWHDAKMLSEFSESIRTIYELLSGNVCVCDGMKGVPVEDRMESFVISKKFGLDWRQSFGMRLWYAIAHRDSVAAAVSMFGEDIAQDKEGLPRPWYTEQGIVPLWNDGEAEQREDLLWGLLKLYADDKADLEAVLRPENSRLSPLDARLSWQLGVALVSTGNVSFGPEGADKADAATLAYAAQLTYTGDWLEAIFVLLHLRDASSRTRTIQEHLCRHAGLIGPESGPTFSMLIERFRIPATWLWEALALYMRSVKKDASAEVHCLLQAGSFVEAHRVLVHKVAPQAIIERDYATLSALLSQFEGRQGTIAEWALGGEMYSMFLHLLQHRSRGENAPSGLLERLLAGLNAMNERMGDSEITRYAAVSEMADETAKEILKYTKKKQDMELRCRILHLPLTQDRLLAYSVDLGLDRYREVMSH